MSSNIAITRVCDYCKKQFIARTTRTRYCSHTCNSRAYKALKRSEKVEISNIVTVQLLNAALEKAKAMEYLSVSQTSLLFGISRRTIYRLINQGQLNIAKFGKRSVLRRCDLEAFFTVDVIENSLNPVQQFPGLENCYTISEVQKKYKVSSGALYLLIQRQGISKYSIGRYTYVARRDMDTIFNAAGV